MIPQPVREYLVRFIADQTGVTNPVDVFFAWLGFGEGIVSFHAEPSKRNPRRTRLKITGPDADELRAIETGKTPATRTAGWPDTQEHR